MSFGQIRKAFVPFIVAQVPAILALITAKWGASIASEVAGVLSALGVYKVKNDTPPAVNTSTAPTVVPPTPAA